MHVWRMHFTWSGSTSSCRPTGFHFSLASSKRIWSAHTRACHVSIAHASFSVKMDSYRVQTLSNIPKIPKHTLTQGAARMCHWCSTAPWHSLRMWAAHALSGMSTAWRGDSSCCAWGPPTALCAAPQHPASHQIFQNRYTLSHVSSWAIAPVECTGRKEL
jgi:hypothetical protein